MRELTSVADLTSASDDDSLLLWAAQGFGEHVRVWEHRHAVAVACPQLFKRDRLAVRGTGDAAADLVRHAYAELGSSYHVLADASLIVELTARLPGLHLRQVLLGWMEITGPLVARTTATGSGWLSDTELDDVRWLLDDAFPESYAHPDKPGVLRWCGIRQKGALVATAAEAWSAPQVGFVAGVVTRPRVRGCGLATSLCHFLLTELVEDRGRAALMVDGANATAIGLYARLGLRYQALGGGRLAGSS